MICKKSNIVFVALAVSILLCILIFPLRPRTIRAATGDYGWSTPATINDDGLPARHQKNPDMAVMDGLGIYVVWEDYRNSSSAPDIYFSRSTDEGVTWSSNTRVSEAGLGMNNDPHIAVDASGTIYVVWLVTVGDQGVYFARSADGGASWSSSRKIRNWPLLATATTPASLNTDAGNALDLAADTRAGREGHIHMVWTQNYNEEYTKVGLNYASSGNGGDSWSSKTRIADGYPGWELRVDNLAMAFQNGAIYVVWENSFANIDIYLSSSQDGKSWRRGYLTGNQEGIFYTPDVAMDSLGMAYTTYYAWLKSAEDPFNYRGQGILARKTRWGSTKYASKDRVLDDATIHHYKSPDLAAYPGGRVFVAWSQQLPGDLYPSLYVGESDDYAFSWKTPVMVSQTGHYAEDPSLEVGGNGEVYAVWVDRPRTKCCYDIVFSRRDPSTSTPPPPEPVVRTIQPGGGTVLSNDPLESVELNLPKGSFANPTEIVLSTGSHSATAQSEDNNLFSMGVDFSVTAKQDNTPVINLGKPVTITVHYFGNPVISDDNIKLYWYDGTQWVTDGISTVGHAESVITSTTTHFTDFGLFGEVGDQVFLPLINQ